MKPIYYIAQRAARQFYGGMFDLRVVGAEKIVEDRGILYASNHVSFLDPSLMACCFRREIYFLARKTLFDRMVWKWAFPRLNAIPVDQERPDFTSLKTIIARLRAGERVLIFPEGSRAEDGMLLRGSPGVGLVVAKTGVPVVPVRIFGAYEALPRGSSMMRPSQITVVFGDAFELKGEELPGQGKEYYQAVADRIMERIGALELPAAGGPEDSGWRP